MHEGHHRPSIAEGAVADLRAKLLRIIRQSTGCTAQDAEAALDPVLYGIWARATQQIMLDNLP